MGAGGEDTARELEGTGATLEDRDPAELVGVGIEDVVVENVVVLSEDPLAVSLQVGLRRFTLDLIAQDFLLLVGVRDVELIENKHGRGKDSAHHNHRKRGAIDADAGGLHGGQLTGLLDRKSTRLNSS